MNKISNVEKSFNDWKKDYETNVILKNKLDIDSTDIYFSGLTNSEKMDLLMMMENYKHERAKDFMYISMN